jgi:hypothetical protein
MNALVTTTTAADELAPRINEEYEAAVKSLLQFANHAFKAGDLLIEAKGLVPHGQWLDWLAEHTEISERTAQVYMQMAERIPVENRSDCCGLSMREILESIKVPRLEDHSQPSDPDDEDDDADTDDQDAGDDTEESDDENGARTPTPQFRKSEEEYADEIVGEFQAEIQNLESEQDLDRDLLVEILLEKVIYVLRPGYVLVPKPEATPSVEAKPKGKGGRPPGSKNKPKVPSPTTGNGVDTDQSKADMAAKFAAMETAAA